MINVNLKHIHANKTKYSRQHVVNVLPYRHFQHTNGEYQQSAHSESGFRILYM